MSKILKSVEKIREKWLKPVILLVIMLVLSFPEATLSQGFEPKLVGPVPDTALKAYYSGPSLPEIEARQASRSMTIMVTAYNSEPGQTDSTPFITASGTRTRDGVIAANFLPIGTIVRFPDVFGEKEFIVEDRMNARYYYKADIWMAEKQDALNFGAKVLKIDIL